MNGRGAAGGQESVLGWGDGEDVSGVGVVQSVEG